MNNKVTYTVLSPFKWGEEQDIRVAARMGDHLTLKGMFYEMVTEYQEGTSRPAFLIAVRNVEEMRWLEVMAEDYGSNLEVLDFNNGDTYTVCPEWGMNKPRRILYVDESYTGHRVDVGSKRLALGS